MYVIHVYVRFDTREFSCQFSASDLGVRKLPNSSRGEPYGGKYHPIPTSFRYQGIELLIPYKRL